VPALASFHIASHAIRYCLLKDRTLLLRLLDSVLELASGVNEHVIQAVIFPALDTEQASFGIVALNDLYNLHELHADIEIGVVLPRTVVNLQCHSSLLLFVSHGQNAGGDDLHIAIRGQW
jgi:hypothetical protein